MAPAHNFPKAAAAAAALLNLLRIRRRENETATVTSGRGGRFYTPAHAQARCVARRSPRHPSPRGTGGKAAGESRREAGGEAGRAAEVRPPAPGEARRRGRRIYDHVRGDLPPGWRR